MMEGSAGWDYLKETMTRGLRGFLFYLAVLCLFRLFFLLWMQEYLGDATRQEIFTALWRGLCLSAQTAGALVFVPLAPALLAGRLWRWLERALWKYISAAEIFCLVLLFVASFPFYRQFHANFNPMLFHTVHEDIYALFISLVQEFYLPARLALATLLSYLLWLLFQRMVLKREKNVRKIQFSASRRVIFFKRAAFVLLCILTAMFSFFGGSFSWKQAVNWENAGVTRNVFLNELILDNVQAVYRAYVLHNRMLACNGLNFTAEDIKNLAALEAGVPASTNRLDVYLTKVTQGAQVEKPRHVFLILDESYAQWPHLEKYAQLHLADGMKEIIAEEDTAVCRAFLPNGGSTVSAVTGVVTGFADANLYLTSMPESFRGPYPTAAAPQMEELGYKTIFWYAGPSTWEQIGAFTLGQGFDKFYSRGDFGDLPGSVWGCEDKYFFDSVLERLGDEPTFHVLLTASNHSPFDVDVDAEGFPREEVRRVLPKDAQDDEHLLTELGHYWYADRELARFVRAVKERYPDSIFLITGDHADRYNIDKTPNLYERYTIPLILTGRGVHHEIFPKGAAGSQIDLVPTLLELIAPEGMEYLSVGKSLTRGNNAGVNYGFWIRDGEVGHADTVPLLGENFTGGKITVADDEALTDYINAVRGISWWYPKYGNLLDETLIER